MPTPCGECRLAFLTYRAHAAWVMPPSFLLSFIDVSYPRHIMNVALPFYSLLLTYRAAACGECRLAFLVSFTDVSCLHHVGNAALPFNVSLTVVLCLRLANYG